MRFSPGLLTLALLVGCPPAEPGVVVPPAPPVPGLSAALPSDVDVKEQEKLEAEKNFSGVQRLFDEVSWQSFVALNWPHADGKPAPTINGKGNLFWSTYAESYEVFKADGSTPDPYEHARTTLPPIAAHAALAAQNAPNLSDPTHRVLFSVSATKGRTVLDEVDQAFSTTLRDQKGNLVHYEILLNRDEYDFIKENQLYNLQGQVAYAGGHDGKVVFPAGDTTSGTTGAIEVKLAWRVLVEGDVKGRYLTTDAWIVSEGDTPRWEKVTAGLVGMHIAHKTASSPQWIWSTFEHVDNLAVNDFAAFGHTELPSGPSFNDPRCEWCPVNVLPGGDQKAKTQVTRVTPIPKATQALNTEWQAKLAANQSVLQYYELVNTQWPTDPTAAPEANSTTFPDFLSNKSGGDPTPVYLVNSVMETYFQGGAGNAGSLTLTGTTTPLAIPKGNGGNIPASAIPGVGTGATSDNAFASESCMGCHFSASIAVSGSGSDPTAYTQGADLSGDFSWLLSAKAQPAQELSAKQ